MPLLQVGDNTPAATTATGSAAANVDSAATNFVVASVSRPPGSRSYGSSRNKFIIIDSSSQNSCLVLKTA